MKPRKIEELTPAKFRRWLERNKRLRFVPQKSDKCPLARYMGGGSAVGCVHYRPHGRGVNKGIELLPAWATNFVTLFDRTNAKKKSTGYRAALSVLLKTGYTGG
jgi:hypothetical protein